MSTIPGIQVLMLLAFGAGAVPASVPARVMYAARQHTRSEAGGVSLLELQAHLSLRDTPLVEGLMRLHDVSGVAMVFSPSSLPAQRVVSCNCEALSVGEALDEMLSGMRLRYVERGGHVVVTPDLEPQIELAQAGPRRIEVRLASISTPSHTRMAGTISGLVTEAASERPLAGAQIGVSGTAISAETNNQGRFLLQNVPEGEATIRVVMIGYAPAEETVVVQSEETAVINISLEARAIALDEIVATGTARATERRRVGNTLAVLPAAKLVEIAPVTDVLELVQGRVAGVAMFPTSGVVGTGGSIRIRGITSVTQDNKAIIYIDGVRADASSNALSVGGQEPTRLTDLNPNDIERMEVVKGAAATTLYGTQAAGGVIQIFTKQGRTGPPQWTAVVEQGAERLATDRFPGRLWTQFEGPDGFQAHDPKDIVQTGHFQNYQLSVGGGAEALGYYLSGGFKRQEGSVTPEVNWLRQAHSRVNLNAVLSPTLSAAVNVGYVNSLLRMPENDNALHGVYSQVVSGIPYTADVGRPWGERWGSHEINKTIETYQSINRFTGGLRIDHDPGSLFSQSLVVGLDWYQQLDEKYYPYGFEGSGNSLGAKDSRQRQVSNVTLDYRGSLSHELGANLTSELAGGFQANFDRIHTTEAEGQDFPGPGLRTVSATSIQEGSEDWVNETNAGFFSQLAVGFFDRLFFTTGVRFDGNSAFGENFPFKAYPKASLAYSISEEGFWPTEIAPTMKLRAAYGTAGRAPTQFAADRTYEPTAAENGQPAVTPANIGDPDLGPETSHELEVGFDAGLWDDRLGLEVTYYRQKTVDALVARLFPASLGFDNSQLVNIGEIQNSGLEFALNALILTGERVNWDASLQLFTQSNEVTSLGGEPPFSGGNSTRVAPGYPATGKWTPVVTGWDPVERTHIISDTAAYRGDATPKWSGSLSTSLRLFGNLALSGLADFATGHVAVNFARGWAIGKLTGDEYLALLERPHGGSTPASDSLLNMWQGVGNSGWVEKADYLRLRELSITYMFPSQFSPLGLTNSSIRLAGRNLMIWAPNWTGPDPQVKYGGHDDLNIGYDFNTMPMARRFTIAFRTGW